MAVPVPRCHAHHVHLASCEACSVQRAAERKAALARIERARQEAGAL